MIQQKEQSMALIILVKTALYNTVEKKSIKISSKEPSTISNTNSSSTTTHVHRRPRSGKTTSSSKEKYNIN